jgi:hypothetical protein
LASRILGFEVSVAGEFKVGSTPGKGRKGSCFKSFLRASCGNSRKDAETISGSQNENSNPRNDKALKNQGFVV